LKLLGGAVECETLGVGWEYIFLMDRHHFQLQSNKFLYAGNKVRTSFRSYVA
jgi:hypothetical protein